MGKMCYLCHGKASKLDRVSLFMFPKDSIARDKWIIACDLLPSDNLKSIYICSMHFSATDIDRGNQFQTRCTLKKGAVPSIDVPKKLCINNENIDTVNNKSETIMETDEVEITSTPENSNELESIEININTRDVHTISEEVSFQQCPDFIKRRQLDTEDVTECNEVAGNFTSSNEDYYTTPKKRRIFEPRFISEIRTPDLQTPKRARRILNFVRDTDKRKSKLIKSLQDRNRKLEKRIVSLQQIISDLKKKNMVSNDTGNTLLEIHDIFDHSYATKMHKGVKKDHNTN